MHRTGWRAWVGAAVVGMAAAAAAARADRPPRIEHTPATAVFQGHAVVIRARIVDDTPPLRQARLHVTTSPDAAPTAVPMAPAGADTFIGTIPAAFTAGARELRYYIEAVDAAENAAESRWFTVPVRVADASTPPPAAGGDAADAGGGRPRWVTPTLIAGGAALVIGGAVLASDGGGGGGSSGGGSSTNTAGTYAGSVTEIFRTSSNTTARTAGVSFVVTSDGTILTDNLRPETTLQARLSGGNFLLRAPVSEQGYQGEIRYVGNVVGGRVVGTIEGQASAADGATAAYSGTFSAQKQ